MGIVQLFRKSAYNGKRPFVLVDISDDEPSRGDVHGFVGLAKRVAEKAGAEYLQLDNATMEQMFPDIPSLAGDPGGHKRVERFRRLFNEKGCPDFYFSTKNNTGVLDILNSRASGVAVRAINESIAPHLRDHGILGENDVPNIFVPHHLTPAVLSFEGRKFAAEFAEMPRPFIGILAATISYSNLSLAERIGGLQESYPEATVFVCSSRRAQSADVARFSRELEESLTGGKFHVVTFDYCLQMQNEGAGNFWNPYIGLLDQADHLIMTGDSYSIHSEVMATGKTLHIDNAYFCHNGPPRFKKLETYRKGEPLNTEHTTPLDVTDNLADAIIRLHRKNAAEVGPSLALRKAVNKLKAKAGLYPRSLYVGV